MSARTQEAQTLLVPAGKNQPAATHRKAQAA
jgi:hypothetical protein